MLASIYGNSITPIAIIGRYPNTNKTATASAILASLDPNAGCTVPTALLSPPRLYQKDHERKQKQEEQAMRTNLTPGLDVISLSSNITPSTLHSTAMPPTIMTNEAFENKMTEHQDQELMHQAIQAQSTTLGKER